MNEDISFCVIFGYEYTKIEKGQATQVRDVL